MGFGFRVLDLGLMLSDLGLRNGKRGVYYVI